MNATGEKMNVASFLPRLPPPPLRLAIILDKLYTFPGGEGIVAIAR